jgi:hypothetical protein
VNSDLKALAALAKWDCQTLDTLRVRANARPDGVAYEDVVLEDDTRIVLAICFCGNGLSLDALEVIDAGHPVTEDWDKVYLINLAIRAAASGGIIRAERSDAIALITAEPDTIKSMANVFNLTGIDR